MPGIKPGMTMKVIAVFLTFAFSTAPAYADAAFTAFLQTLWPQAASLGVSRATFDAATRGLEPDLTLPDL
ncbi:MAG: lytic murein transglycosylase, partial [Xanthobacteraceae bacterium]